MLLAAATVGPLGLMSAPAQAADLSASDAFSRTQSGGWGQADTGGAWSVSPGSQFGVAAGAGTVSLTTDGQTRQATLPGTGTNTDLTTTLSASRTPTGSGLYVSVIGRRVANVGQYQAKVRLLAGGAVAVSLGRTTAGWAESALTGETVVPGVQAAEARQIRVRVQVTGTSPTTLRAKVWQATAAEPAAWNTTVTDATAGWQAAGGVGLFSYLSRSSAPLTLRVDELAAGPVTGGLAAPQPPASQPPAPQAPAPQAPAPQAPAPEPPAAPATPVSSNRSTGAAGSATVGSTSYAVPAGAFHVSPSGNDSASGSASAPWRTLARAVAAAPAGSTVVLRGGTYHESVTVPTGKRLTIQAYPREAVWLDGSRDVTGWAADGSAWRANGWTAEFDHSPTYTKGAPDGTAANWGFINAAYPMASYPDQLWIDGAAQRQVGSRNAVVPGTFFVDTAGDRLYLGTNPSGRNVRASDLSIGLTVRGAGSVVRGIGVQRYATPVPDKGAVRLSAPDVTVENVVIRDNATQAVLVGGVNEGVRNTLRNVTIERNGMLGIEAPYADGLVLDAVRVVGNNTEHFNMAPVAGGVKIGRSRNITVTDSVFADNLGTGLWFDESVYNVTATGNDILRNAGNGLSFEISSKGLIADNIVAGNGQVGLKINNASSMDIWNNTVVDNGGRPMWVVQDRRLASNLSTPGHDPRQNLPDPSVTWLLGPVTIRNNVIGGGVSSNCLLCVQDSELFRKATDMGITANGNAYHRTSAGSPRLMVHWPVGARDPKVYETIGAFRSATGQEANGAEYTGAPIVDGSYRLTSAVAGSAVAIAQPVPAAIASRMGFASGEERLGARTG
ncbi:right-handed parallel beta-helix repeat-containing protein [Blastococcus sp. CT_GayMR16]|uniref:right-handed parallel beta-helix repeat-containing protein n=1 Tax=Blastococcus sp. CT_GayMR16 TaxID=2559607 RepID=UPI001073E3B2|nr:right-handed parallel beta-helix repeat-containing protein [Blastococcus sp. CT_GayMR16]TFV86606.1 right-handed parallel beta-helix repeat-containing protein [Blastococcus sp. CT_GayMR16]